MNVIIFSKNRGCQLELLLRSLRFKVEHLNLKVLYTYDPPYKTGYDKVMKLYPNVEFILEEDFRKQVISSITDEYIMFLVDDDVMIDLFSEDCPQFRKFQTNEDIICLNLRMARNYDYDFLKNKQVPIPKFDKGMWEWKNYRHDWGYPMSVRCHIFRKTDILPILKTIEFTDLHKFAHNMQGRLDKPLMIGFKKVKFVHISVNRVASNAQRSSKFIPASYLNDKFMEGFIIDLKPIIKEAKKTRSCLMPVDLKLIKTFFRKKSSKPVIKTLTFLKPVNKTIIYYTSNREDPVFEQKIIDDMLSKAGNLPIISVSQKPMKLGKNLCIGDVGHSYLNCRKQMLMATELAQTEYIIHTESDILYPPEYFQFQPKGDNIYRYLNVWVMWLKDKNRKNFYHKPDTFDGAMICKRDFSIAALTKYLEPYPGWYTESSYKPSRVPWHKIQKNYIYGEIPCIHIKTEFGLAYTTGVDEKPESTRRSLPYWGNVEKLRAKLS